MSTIQLVQISPEELASLIQERLKPQIREMVNSLPLNAKSDEEFLSRGETATFLKISKVTLHDWVNKGILTPYKLSNRTYFRKSELVAKLLSSNTHE